MQPRKPIDNFDTEASVKPVSHSAEEYKEGESIKFDQLSDDILERVENFLPVSAQATLARTSSRLYQYGMDLTINGLFSPSNTRIRAQREQVQKLLNHVIKGEQAEANEMLTQDPGLLNEKGTIVDYSGRKYENYTAMQLAYAADDIAIYPEKGHVGMADMLKQHFDRANQSNLIAQQIHEKFPEGAEHGPAFDFQGIIDAIRSATTAQLLDAVNLTGVDTQLWQALENFRKAFTDLSLKELRFNPNHLLVASRLGHYHGKFDDCYRDIVYTRQVLGYVQRYMSTCYLQACAQGTYFLVDHGPHHSAVALKRSFLLRDDCLLKDGDASIFPFGRLGYEYCVNEHGRKWLQSGQWGAMAPLLDDSFKIICEKNKKLGKLCAGTITPRPMRNKAFALLGDVAKEPRAQASVTILTFS